MVATDRQSSPGNGPHGQVASGSQQKVPRAETMSAPQSEFSTCGKDRPPEQPNLFLPQGREICSSGGDGAKSLAIATRRRKESKRSQRRKLVGATDSLASRRTKKQRDTVSTQNNNGSGGGQVPRTDHGRPRSPPKTKPPVSMHPPRRRRLWTDNIFPWMAPDNHHCQRPADTL